MSVSGKCFKRRVFNFYGELTRKPNGSLSSPARNLLTNKTILKIVLKFENLKIQCKQQHELNKNIIIIIIIIIIQYGGPKK